MKMSAAVGRNRYKALLAILMCWLVALPGGIAQSQCPTGTTATPSFVVCTAAGCLQTLAGVIDPAVFPVAGVDLAAAGGDCTITNGATPVATAGTVCLALVDICVVNAVDDDDDSGVVAGVDSSAGGASSR